ncbi:MAG: sugar ABC transporter ATP-binding protein [Gemmataceae bacterium]
MSNPVIEALGISKCFGGVAALQGVHARVSPGEVVAIVGENGAGKSTLMKVLAGIHRPDEGELQLDGQPVRFSGVPEAMAAGIALIHQELNLAENLSIAANLFLGRETGLVLSRSRENEATEQLLRRVGLSASPQTMVSSLAPGQKQLVEIARALSRRARVIIFDEPTSSLTQRETERLYEVIDDLKRQGVAVLYISHRLAEVRRLADRVTVLRDGKNAGELARHEISHEAMVRLMVGRDLKQLYPRMHRCSDTAPVRLEVCQLSRSGSPHPVSFQLRAGEIVGMAGLVGAGRTELAEALFGIRPIMSGEVRLDGRPIKLGSPRQAMQAGLALVPEDRRHHGLILPFSIRDNLALPNYDRLNWLGLIRWGTLGRLVEQLMSRLRVRAVSPVQPVGQLSGGNQQKVVLGKWLARSPIVLLLDEPTCGVDVGARSEIYALMDELAAAGAAILMISSDMEEVLGMSDRVLVMHEGRLAGQLDRTAMNEEAIMRLATGGMYDVSTAGRAADGITAVRPDHHR